MAKANKTRGYEEKKGKKTRQGNGKNTKWGNKGGGNDGTTPSKLYRKKPRGQGK